MTFEDPDTSSNPFRIDAGTEEDHQVISPHGELDMSTVSQLEQRLAEALAAGDTVLDLSGVTFIDSSGIALLVSISQAARDQGRRLELRNPSPHVRKLIRLTGVQSLLGSPERQVVAVDRRAQDDTG